MPHNPVSTFRGKVTPISSYTLPRQPSLIEQRHFIRRYAAQWACLRYLPGLETQRHFCDATGDVETSVAFDAEWLQRN